MNPEDRPRAERPEAGRAGEERGGLGAAGQPDGLAEEEEVGSKRR